MPITFNQCRVDISRLTLLYNMYNTTVQPHVDILPVSCCHTLSSSMLPTAPPPLSPPCRLATLLLAAFLRLLLRGRVWVPRAAGPSGEEEGKEAACSMGFRGRVLKRAQRNSHFLSRVWMVIGHSSPHPPLGKGKFYCKTVF